VQTLLGHGAHAWRGDLVTPDQVPEEWIDTVIRTAADFTHADLCGCDGWPRDCCDSLTIGQLETDNEREVVAAAYPLIAAKVRAELSADLYERAMRCQAQTGMRRGLIAAHQIVNPPTIEDAARALQAMYEQDIARGEA
jgi:hypothetical protein